MWSKPSPPIWLITDRFYKEFNGQIFNLEEITRKRRKQFPTRPLAQHFRNHSQKKTSALLLNSQESPQAYPEQYVNQQLFKIFGSGSASMQGGGSIDMADAATPQNKLTLKSAITENFKESKSGTYNK